LQKKEAKYWTEYYKSNTMQDVGTKNRNLKGFTIQREKKVKRIGRKEQEGHNIPGREKKMAEIRDLLCKPVGGDGGGRGKNEQGGEKPKRKEGRGGHHIEGEGRRGKGKKGKKTGGVWEKSRTKKEEGGCWVKGKDS